MSWLPSARVSGLFCLLWVLCMVEACRRDRKHTVNQDRLWAFTANGNRKPYNYLDNTGKLVGFEIDLGDAVCAFAGKKCEWVRYDFKECSTSDENDRFFPGRGLLEGWFDTCGGRIITEERMQYVRFTEPYTDKSFARFLVKEGNPRNFSVENIQGRTLTYLAGTYTNQVCLDTIGVKGATLRAAPGINEAVELVLTEQVDAFFGPRTRIAGFDRLPGDYDCSLGGNAFMTLPNNEFADWWNPAFDRFRASGKFEELCEESQEKHGTIRCI